MVAPGPAREFRPCAEKATTRARSAAMTWADQHAAHAALARRAGPPLACASTRQEAEAAMNTIMTPAGLAELAGPSRPLEGRVAIVTGSTSGIGLGIAEALAAQGAAVVLNGFGPTEEIATTCRRLAEIHDVPVRHDEADMAKPGDIVCMVKRTARAFGPCDILVNNAGIQHVAQIEDFPPGKWDAILAINLSAAFHAMRAVLPRMKARRFGRIVNIASAHGLVASPFKSAYVAAKHGVVGLTKAAALEAAESGVTCNAVCPGYVWTPLVAGQVAQQAVAHGLSEEEVVRKIFLAEQPNHRLHHRHRAAGRWRLDGPLKGCRSWTGPGRPARRAGSMWCWYCRAAARSAPTRPACSRRCTRPASNRTG
jgi:3-hydroxybutyrate dehydrogenase